MFWNDSLGKACRSPGGPQTWSPGGIRWEEGAALEAYGLGTNGGHGGLNAESSKQGNLGGENGLKFPEGPVWPVLWAWTQLCFSGLSSSSDPWAHRVCDFSLVSCFSYLVSMQAGTRLQ